MNGVSYLATPYSKYPTGQEEAFKEACRISAKLLLMGIRVYSPIAHTHPIALYGSIDLKDHSIWLAFDEAMLSVSTDLIIAHMEGWDSSVGVAHEIKFFEDAKKPIWDLDPVTLELTLRK